MWTGVELELEQRRTGLGARDETWSLRNKEAWRVGSMDPDKTRAGMLEKRKERRRVMLGDVKWGGAEVLVISPACAWSVLERNVCFCARGVLSGCHKRSRCVCTSVCDGMEAGRCDRCWRACWLLCVCFHAVCVHLSVPVSINGPAQSSPSSAVNHFHHFPQSLTSIFYLLWWLESI